MFSYVGIKERLRPDHPLRAIRALTDETLAAMERDLAALYAGIGGPSIASQMLLRAILLQAFYSVRSECQMMERMEFDLLFRWFVGLGADEPVWDASNFSKNRDRLLDGNVAARFLATLLAPLGEAAAVVGPLLTTSPKKVRGTATVAVSASYSEGSVMTYFSPLIAIGVMASTAVTDAAYVFFNAAVSERRRFAAASWSSVWYLLSAFAVISYTHNAYYVLFAAAGSWLGAFVSLSLMNKRGEGSSISRSKP